VTVGRAAVRAALATLVLAGGCAPAGSTATPGLPSRPATPVTAPPTAAAAPASPSAPGPATSPTASAASGPPASTGASPAAQGFAHIYLLILENHEYGSIVGSSDAPYLNGLIARYGLATAMDAVAHPSEPNYIALVSGGTQGVRDDGVHNLDAPSLFDQVESSGRTWRVFAQGYPGGCSPVAFSPAIADGPGQPGDYARKHNPAISFTAISGDPSRCAGITRLAGFDPAAADLEVIIPNEINDMHSASVATGDAFLAAFVPSILDSAPFRAGSLLIVTFDEGDTNVGGGGHIATVLATPGMTPGTRFDAPATHYSVLRTIEDAWGMPPLGAAADASAIPVRG
jgi:hypothetical protein